MRDLPGGMPCAPAGQFRFFKKNRVLSPSFVGEVVGQSGAHHTAAYNDHARVGRECFLGHIGLPLDRDTSVSRNFVANLLDTVSEHLYHSQS